MVDGRLNKLYSQVLDELNRADKQTTIENYQYSLSLLHSYIKTRKKGLSIEFFSEQVLTGFYHWLLSGHEISSCNTVLSNIRGLLKRISQKDIMFTALYENARLVEKARVRKQEEEILSDDEIVAILDSINVKTKFGFRYYCMISIMLTSGLRIDEELSLRIKDLHILDRSAYAVVIGKGKKKRTVPIANTVIPCLLEYIQTWHGECPIRDAFLFYSPQYGCYEKATRSGIHKQFKLYLTNALGPEKARKLHLHSLRRTAATKWHLNGMSYPQISKILGHKYMQTTKKYVKTNMQKLIDYLKAIPPVVEKKRVSAKKRYPNQTWLDGLFEED